MFTGNSMSTKILDICNLTMHVSELDEQGPKAELGVGDDNNDKALQKASAHFLPQSGHPFFVRMVLVETESLVGSSVHEVVTLTCNAVEVRPEQLVRPSLGQALSLVSFFRGERSVQRTVPISSVNSSHCLLWNKPLWPTIRSRPALYFLGNSDFIHGDVWVMLPLLHL